ncbi:MAG: hypothetical protein JWQ73_1045, partial [Variovorax sp.]|nr:hypothetical protein [Variovorax sp.]
MIELKDIHQTYEGAQGRKVEALRGIDL